MSVSNVSSFIDTFAAAKNKLINGNFDFWRRGTSFANAGNTSAAGSNMTADRWFHVYDGSGATRAISQQTFTLGSASNPPLVMSNTNSFYRWAQTVAGTGGSYNLLEQRVEGSGLFPNQIMTFSFWAKAASTITLPQIDYEYTVGATNASSNIVSNISIGTTWQRYVTSFTLPSYSGLTGGTSDYLGMRIWAPVNATFTLDIANVQLEQGASATGFSTCGGSYAVEDLLCRRYTPIIKDVGVSMFGWATTTTTTHVAVPFSVTARVAPSAIAASSASNFTVYNAGLSSGAVTSVAITDSSTVGASLTFASASGAPTLTQYQPGKVTITTSGGYILFNGCDF
jgi:hypothetical protein